MATDLPGDASAAAAARRLVEVAIPEGPLRQDALIVVSELVANAWSHGDPPISLILKGDGDGPPSRSLRIAVTNRQRLESASVPELNVGGRPDGLGGRGIDLVAAVARDWGWQLDDGIMTVWARLAPLPSCPDW